MSTETARVLSANGWRQACRMTLGGIGGWSIASLLGWSSVSLYAVFPLVLMGLVPMLNRHVVRQFLSSAVIAMTSAGIILTLPSSSPVSMAVVFAVYALSCFWLMTTRGMFLLGATSLIMGSILMHQGSYPGTHWDALFWAVGRAAVCTVLLATVAYAIFPDVEPRAVPASPIHSSEQRRHLIILGSTAATLSFCAFQTMDLADAQAAQVASDLVLLALTRDAIWRAGKGRLGGTTMGTLFALLAQLVLLGYSENWLLTGMVLLVGLIYFSADHARQNAGPAHGFAAVTSLAILFGQLAPGDDLVGNALYRAFSVVISVCCMMAIVTLIHHALNRFAPVRWDT